MRTHDNRSTNAEENIALHKRDMDTLYALAVAVNKAFEGNECYRRMMLNLLCVENLDKR